MRRTAAPPWSPNFRDEHGNYPNSPKEEAESLEEFAARVFAALDAGEIPDDLEDQFDEDYLAAEDARASFAEFFRQAWPIVDPTAKLVWNWHLALMCAVVQVVFFDWLRAKEDENYFNRVRNVIFNVPPGSSKSRILSVMFQAWAWLHCPGMKFLCLSVNEDAMMRDARFCRDLIQDPWYQKRFQPTWSLKADQDAVSSYAITAGGDRISKPMKSEIVGLRADCILIDDPNNPRKAENKNERDEINELWSTNQYNRVNDLARSLRIGVQQRTHVADWTGAVLELQGVWTPPCGDPKCDKRKPAQCCNRDGWLHVVIPAEFDSSRRFVMPALLQQQLRDLGLAVDDLVMEDPRSIEGETFDARRFNADVLAGERKRWEGTGNFAGQMQQSPFAADGNKVDRKWWNWCRLAKGVRPDIDDVENGRPRPVHCHSGDAVTVHQKHYAPDQWDFDWITISIDAASKKTEKGSNYGILVIAGKGGRKYVLDDATQRGALHEIIEVLVGSDTNPERPRSSGLVQKWRPDSILIEPKAAGPDVMDTLLEQMGKGDIPMVSIWECEPGNTDKELRLEAAIPYIKNGMVYLLDGAPWLEEFIKELSAFPNGKHDDRVDALSQCLNFKREVDADYPDL